MFQPDFDAYRKNIGNADFMWLNFAYPTNENQTNAAKIALDCVVWSLNTMFHLTLNSSRLQVQEKMVLQPKFPTYFNLNSKLWSYVLKRNEETISNFLKSLSGIF